MGTRNLTIIRKDGENKVAQYGQWDGYPSYSGKVIIDALNRKDALALLNKSVDNTSWATEEDIRDAWESVGANPESQFVSYDTGQEFEAKYPTFGRDMGAEIVGYMVDHPEGVKVEDASSFSDDYACEWVYVIDLDKDIVEAYGRYFDTEETISPESGVISENSGMKLVSLDKIDDMKNLERLCEIDRF